MAKRRPVLMIVDMPEARVRRMESGRLLLELPGFTPMYFDDHADLEEHLHDVGRYGPYQNGLIIDNEPERLRMAASARVGACGTQAGEAATR